MKPIRSLMGRRQFLIAAGVTSTLGLGFKKLTGIFDQSIQTGVATASEMPGASGVKGNFSDRYSHLMSPFTVRNVIVKNRMFYTLSTPHFLQGPETYPGDVVRHFYAEVAKNAAIVTVRDSSGRGPRSEMSGDSAHMASWDGDDPAVQNYVDQLVEGVHSMGSLISGGRLGGGMRGAAQTPVKMEDIITQAKKLEDNGIDVVSIGGRNLQDEDAARSAMEQMEAVRSATNLLIMTSMMVVLPGVSREMSMGGGMPGGDMPEMQQGGTRGGGMPQQSGMPGGTGGAEGGRGGMPEGGMPEMQQGGTRGGGMPGGGMPGGMTGEITGFSLEEAVAAAKRFEGMADILFIKVAGGLSNHPNSFNQEKGKPEVLRVSQAIKESGAKIITCPNGGFRDPGLNEEYIKSGKTDMIGMARAFISEPEYSQKAYEGRGEDMVPCVMCNKCHGTGFSGPWISVCSVNPELGLSSAVKAIDPPVPPKKVAVIGGGPAGMKAAITAAERGHKVTLYEKTDALGGLLRHADYSPLKWTYKDFKDYLIRQTYKAGVEVLLNTEATPNMIKGKGYDVVMAAAGAEPIIPRIPGADGKKIWNVVDVYPNEKTIGKNVVIVGGGEIGAETGMFLAKLGHQITALTSGRVLMDAGGPHVNQIQMDLYERMDNFTYITQATTKRISNGKVTYTDANGSEKSIQADDVIIYAGLKPRMEEAMKFKGTANRFLILGDCTGKAGTIQKTMRSAFFTASQV